MVFQANMEAITKFHTTGTLWLVDLPSKRTVLRKAFPCHDFLMVCIMMTSSNGNILRVTSHWCGEFTDHQWIPCTKASDAELWCFLWCCAWINVWVNNGEVDDLRRHCAHYDVTDMCALRSWNLGLPYVKYCVPSLQPCCNVNIS